MPHDHAGNYDSMVVRSHSGQGRGAVSRSWFVCGVEEGKWESWRVTFKQGPEAWVRAGHTGEIQTGYLRGEQALWVCGPSCSSDLVSCALCIVLS